MPRFSANISLMFGEVPMLERPAAARAAGFQAVEVQFPYEAEAGDWASALETAGVELVQFNLAAGDRSKGEAGLAALPDRRDEFRFSVSRARRYAEATGARRVTVLAGVPGRDVPSEQARDCLVENLVYAADKLADLDVTILLEAVNMRDVPGFFINQSSQALATIFAVDRPSVKLQYDCYHMQIMEGDLIPTMERLKDYIGHIQFADTPGRHEPGTGEINFPNIFKALDAMGYDGWVGAEYVPSGRTEDSLGWFEG